jgi:sporulation protein YlmC with PRC-barrel domain
VLLGIFLVEISKLFWKRTFTSDGIFLGEIDSADLDVKTWQIRSLFVKLTDEASTLMGFKHPYLGKVVVCLPVEDVKSIEADVATLNHTMAELTNLRQCKE